VKPPTLASVSVSLSNPCRSHFQKSALLKFAENLHDCPEHEQKLRKEHFRLSTKLWQKKEGHIGLEHHEIE